MNLNISGHRMEMTDALRNYVTDKMAKIERHFDHLIDANVILKVDKPNYIAEITMQIRGATIHAESKADDMYAAINDMVEKLDKQTRRHRDKAVDQRVRSKVNAATGADEA